MRQNGVRSNVRFPYGKAGMKAKGGSQLRNKDTNDRKDESIAMRKKKKRIYKITKLVASRRDESRWF